MSINLNDNAYDQKEVSIFNNGEAGIVENVSISVFKKKKDDKETLPDYSIVFTDENGKTTNMGFYHIKEATQYKTVEEQVMDRGKKLKHLFHAILGKDYQIPSFETHQQMLDVSMKLFSENVGSNKFRVFANYGTTTSKKAYIQIRTFVPFIESMSVPKEDSRLELSTIDNMIRLQADPKSTTQSTAELLEEDDSDWT